MASSGIDADTTDDCGTRPKPEPPAPSQPLLTAFESRLLRIMRGYNTPLGAYELMKLYQEEHAKPVSPPTVYRALERFLQTGLAVRIARRNAFYAYRQPLRDQTRVLYLCQRCGAVIEADDGEIDACIEKWGTNTNFQIIDKTVHIEGICRDCQLLRGLRDSNATLSRT